MIENNRDFENTNKIIFFNNLHYFTVLKVNDFFKSFIPVSEPEISNFNKGRSLIEI